MEHSPYIDQAAAIIDSVKGRSLTEEKRGGMAALLASLMLQEARRIETHSEKRVEEQFERMIEDPVGKSFAAALTDQCFRSQQAARIADQIHFLIKTYGIPRYLPCLKKLQLRVFQWLGGTCSHLLVPVIQRLLRREASQVIIAGESRPLKRHMDMRQKSGFRVNLNRLGEAILGEKEAETRLQLYLQDLSMPEVEYISVKVSTLYSQIHLLAWEDTLAVLQKRLKALYREAKRHVFILPSGKRVPKFVNLDMEEYKDLHLTVELFRRVLDDPEFFDYSAGIVLQSYLPDSYPIQQELTAWAMQRVAAGGAPIKIRLVKGANLAMEKVDASLHGWPQAPYQTKQEADANFKQMVAYACKKEHCRAARVGIGSHNLFAIAYCLLLRAELGVEPYVEFEMLEGMADHLGRVVKTLCGTLLFYCPAAKKQEFPYALAYFVRRLDENTAQENFLRHMFGLQPDTEEWQKLADSFSLSCRPAKALSHAPRRTQDRNRPEEKEKADAVFTNEPPTDWCLLQNRRWAEGIIKKWKEKDLEDVPLVFAGSTVFSAERAAVGKDPSFPYRQRYRFALADQAQIHQALECAAQAGKRWQEEAVERRIALLQGVAGLLRKNRGELIGAMVADGAKIVYEADYEVSEAIDFIEYYTRDMQELLQLQDIRWHPLGTCLVAPPWNFPLAIPLGGIAAALVTGNSVIFKPAKEAAYVGWRLANLFWEAGIGREVLQLIFCDDEPVGTALVQDPRLSCVILTGSSETAKKMLALRSDLRLVAEAGGKNAIIITELADRDLAIKDLIISAFSHAGQKCSACSLAIALPEVYDSLAFRRALKDAAESLRVGIAWDLATQVNPLIREPEPKLLAALTTLEEGEFWLVEPKRDKDHPFLWSPGIKMGVSPGSTAHQTEFFGPVLAVMRAKTLEEAIVIANGTPYGLTSGIHTLDEREIAFWKEHIESGNLYVNRTITGAIVGRQPFGGCKESSFGWSAKAGGPNFLLQLMKPEQAAMPKKRMRPHPASGLLRQQLQQQNISHEELEMWQASMESFAYYYRHCFSQETDPCRILGQDNLYKTIPRKKVVFRLNPGDGIMDAMRVVGAAITCGTPLEVSVDPEEREKFFSSSLMALIDNVSVVQESEQLLLQRLKAEKQHRVRCISWPKEALAKGISSLGASLIVAKPAANGRVELFHYLREVSLSATYHRYGNLYRLTQQ